MATAPAMKLADVSAAIQSARSLVALTGAGLSTNAGLADFRGKKGIYTSGQYPPNVFDIETFRRNPKIFYSYGRDFIELEEKLQPTSAHAYLAGLEKKGILKWTITQNIDGLHQKAGSRNVLELHGGYSTSHCIACGAAFDYDRLKDKIRDTWVPRCDACDGVIKPDIVFFGEPVKAYDQAEQIVAGSDLLLIIGTSLAVYPVAFLPELAPGKIIVVNKGETHISRDRAIVFDEDIDEFFLSLAQYR